MVCSLSFYEPCPLIGQASQDDSTFLTTYTTHTHISDTNMVWTHGKAIIGVALWTIKLFCCCISDTWENIFFRKQSLIYVHVICSIYMYMYIHIYIYTCTCTMCMYISMYVDMDQCIMYMYVCMVYYIYYIYIYIIIIYISLSLGDKALCLGDTI